MPPDTALDLIEAMLHRMSGEPTASNTRDTL